MGIIGYSRTAFDYYYHRSDRDNFFKLSDVDSKFMKKHGFCGTVKDFKDKVKNTKPFARVETGSPYYSFRHTAIYRISDFKK